MMLNSVLIPDDVVLIKSLSKRVFPNFSISTKKVGEAILLANYLVAVGEDETAQQLLECFVYEVSPNDDKLDLWEVNGDGIILLAYLSRKLGDELTERKLINVIKENDIVTDSINRFELYKEDIEGHEDYMEYARTEKLNYKCASISSEILKYLYYREMLPFYKDITPKGFDSSLDKMISGLYSELAENLNI